MVGDRESYKKAESCYERIRDNHPEVIREMNTLIDEYIADKDEVQSNQAGRKILPEHEEFRRLCGGMASSVFGILLKAYLFRQEWSLDEFKGGKIYSRY